MHQLPT